jgi:hypothetical protein
MYPKGEMPGSADQILHLRKGSVLITREGVSRVES